MLFFHTYSDPHDSGTENLDESLGNVSAKVGGSTECIDSASHENSAIPVARQKTDSISSSKSWWLSEALVRHNEALLRVWFGGLVGKGEAISPFSNVKTCHSLDLSETVYDHYDVYECHRTFGEFYDVQQVIGKGAFGTVVTARHTDSGIACTVKVINKTSSGDYRKQVVEGGIWNCLLWMTLHCAHPNIVRYYDLMEGLADYFEVMECLEGLELLEQIEQDIVPITEEYCKNAMRQIFAALEHIHDRIGLYHGDVKLENFLYRTSAHDSDLVLVDFGFSRFISEKWDGSVSGTLLYMAPEAVRAASDASHEGYSAPVDLWAAGIVFYIMLTLSLPWESDAVWCFRKSEAEIEAMISKAFAHEKLDAVSMECIALLRQLLELDPRCRITAAGALSHSWFSEAHMPSKKILHTDCSQASEARKASKSSKIMLQKPSPVPSEQPLPLSTPYAQAAGKGFAKVPLCMGPPMLKSCDSVSDEWM